MGAMGKMGKFAGKRTFLEGGMKAEEEEEEEDGGWGLGKLVGRWFVEFGWHRKG
jgi:hypothetical protein